MDLLEKIPRQHAVVDSLFPMGVFINLDKRTDRKCSFLGQIPLSGKLVDQYYRFPAIANKIGPFGCAMSHAAVLRLYWDAFQSGAIPRAPCVVFEDDFVWNVNQTGLDYAHDTLTPFLKSGTEWDVIMMATSTYDLKYTPTEHKGISRANYCYTASGYIIAPHYLPKLLTCFDESVASYSTGRHTPIDVAWLPLQKNDKWFVTVPGLGRQVASYSDNEGRLVNHPYV